jgi:hypothetical protein
VGDADGGTGGDEPDGVLPTSLERGDLVVEFGTVRAMWSSAGGVVTAAPL